MKIKTGVVGTGYLGRFHAEKHKLLKSCDLQGVYDRNTDVATKVATNLGVKAYPDLATMAEEVEAVSIATPTESHFEVAKHFLTKGIHVLIEKPITKTLEEAQQLSKIVENQPTILQVGHLERFNPAYKGMLEYQVDPIYIEALRITPFTNRSVDIDVLLDLMIHDVDLILKLIKKPIESISAVGVPLIGSNIDIANVRLEFENKIVANLTSSRVSEKKERQMRVFSKGKYFSLDLLNQTFSHIDKAQVFSQPSNFKTAKINQEKVDTIMAEIDAFITAIIQKQTPPITIEDGIAALDIITRIQKQILSYT